MRVGYNPYKDKKNDDSKYVHQIIMPVYIPYQEGYFKDSFKILKLCLDSLFATIHKKTFITIVNNGSDIVVADYLELLLKQNKIHELIHTENIGKLNAIVKGLAGSNIELVTISDSDVLFLDNWQRETVNVFNSVPKAGVVGIVPQFKMYQSYCGNILFDTLFSSKLRFIPIKNRGALIRFYDSLGWDRDYNPNYLEYSLGLEINSDLKVWAGSGHFVATYKKDMFDVIPTYIKYKMGGDSEKYLDKLPLKKDYWRVTTYDNYAYHMGNVYEDWMSISQSQKRNNEVFEFDFYKNRQINSASYFIKNRLFTKLISGKRMMKLFLKWKKLPITMIKNY